MKSGADESAIRYRLCTDRLREKAPSLDAEQLLRQFGMTGKLIGFRYVVYMVEQVAAHPECIQLITKRLYPDTGRYFNATATSVERAIRVLIKAYWNRTDHSFLAHITGASMERIPSNSEFIDMLAWCLRQLRNVNADLIL